MLDVELDEERHEARALVAEDQLSLAIGKGGQNVRLAARLTGWKIDVRSNTSAPSAKDAEEVLPEEGASEEPAALEDTPPPINSLPEPSESKESE